MLYPIITISGTPGSGKSTIAQALAKKLKAKRIYVGAVMRQIAKDKSITLAQLQEHMTVDSTIDIGVDKKITAEIYELAKKNIVIAEGRVLYHFIPESIKLFIKVDLVEGAKRIWLSIQKAENRAERNEANVKSFEELLEKIAQRKANNVERYTKYYGIDHTDESQYDFVLDTTNINAQQAIAKTLEFVKNKLK